MLLKKSLLQRSTPRWRPCSRDHTLLPIPGGHRAALAAAGNQAHPPAPSGASPSTGSQWGRHPGHLGMNGHGDLIGAVLAGDADQLHTAAKRLECAPVVQAKMAELGNLGSRITRRARRSTLVRSFSERCIAIRSSFQRNSSSKSLGTFEGTPSRSARNSRRCYSKRRLRANSRTSGSAKRASMNLISS